MMWKIIDKEITKRMEIATSQNGSRLQFGFKKGISCNNAGIIVTEAMMEAKDNKQPVFTCYMDTSKAFDMVDHKELLCALHAQGLHGPTWNLFLDAYKNIRSAVKWQGQISDDFHEGQGIRQGGASSAGALFCEFRSSATSA